MFLTFLFMTTGMVFAQELAITQPSDEYLDYLENPQNYAVPPLPYDPPFEYEGSKAILPSKYSMVEAGYYTPVRNQGSNGMCWAFTGCAAVETAGAMKYGDTTLSFSPLNVLNKNIYKGIHLSLNSGGNVDHYSIYFFSNIGPVLEKDDPYKSPWVSPSVQPKKPGVAENCYRLSDSEYGFTPTEREAIKEHVYTTGGVGIAIYSNDSLYMASDDVSYYTPENIDINHFVTIVGWDDNYSRSKFKYTPDGNGAYLCKNSWGTDRHDNGYFWVSYYDKSLEQACGFTYSKLSEAKYETFLCHGKAVGWQFLTHGVKYGMAVFRPQKSGKVVAMRTWIPLSGTKISYSVNSSTKGMVATGNFDTEFTGYMTHKLSTPYEYQAGEELTLIINYNANSVSGKDRIPLESNWYHYTPVSSEKNNYYSQDGKNWKDLNDFKLNLCAGLLVQEGSSDVKVTGVSLDKTKLTMKKGTNATLTATVKPANATNKEVTWTSSNKDIVYVNASGKVSAYAPGNATITCKTKDGGYKATCKVTVTQPVTGVKVSKSTLTMVVGDEVKIKATVKPEDATDKTVIWSTSKSTVAKVNNGKITAKARGIAIITAITKDGSYKATCKVMVNRGIKVTGITLDKTSIKLKKGTATIITPTIKPSNATNKEVTWSSSNKDVAGVNAKGKVSAYAPGTATITCTTNNGSYKATCKITVK